MCVCVCVRLASIQHFESCEIAKGTVDIFLKRIAFRSYTLTIPFHGSVPIATITITENRMVCSLLFFPPSSSSFSLSMSCYRTGLSNFAVAYSFTESPHTRPNRQRYGIFLVSSDFALFSQPWYIWYSHVHINNVYRNLRAMLTSTFPLRLSIFVLFSAVDFLPHCCRAATTTVAVAADLLLFERSMQYPTISHTHQTERLCLRHTHPKIRDTDCLNDTAKKREVTEENLFRLSVVG